MANKKLNEVTTVSNANISNVKTFLAVMNDGSIQQMSKEDMASVLGGLLGVIGLHVKITEKAAYVFKEFKIGLIFVYDTEDTNKYALFVFTLSEGVKYVVNKLSNQTLVIDGYPNPYGTLSITGGSGNYQYLVVGI